MERIAVIAGMGELPALFLAEASKRNCEIFPIYLFDEVDERVKKFPTSIKYGITQVGKIIKYLKKNDIKRLIMLGKVEKNLVFSNLKFDITAAKILLSSKNKKDKNILMAIVEYLDSEGITVLPQNYFLEDYMVKEFNYTKRIPQEEDIKTIKIGIEAAKMLTAIDAGQTVVTKNESVVALEGIEGTDRTIERAGQYAGKDCIVVKAARPGQDYRIDIPTIGLNTIKKLVEIKAKGLVIEAENMLFLDQKEVIDYADKNKIFIKGIKL